MIIPVSTRSRSFADVGLWLSDLVKALVDCDRGAVAGRKGKDVVAAAVDGAGADQAASARTRLRIHGDDVGEPSAHLAAEPFPYVRRGCSACAVTCPATVRAGGPRGPPAPCGRSGGTRGSCRAAVH